MKIFNLLLLIILAAAMSGAAQTDENSPPPPDAFMVTADKPQKMFISGSVKENLFEMTLISNGENLRGHYFFVRSGRTSVRSLRGKIEGGGKVFLQEFDRMNRAISEFRGGLTVNSNDYDLEFEGEWKSISQKKRYDFYAGGQVIEFTGKQRVENKYISEQSNRRRIKIDATYPQIVDGNAPGAGSFNLVSKQAVVEPVGEFKRRMRRQTTEEVKNLWGDGNTYSISSYIKFADDRLISVAYFYSESSDGMPQPFDYVGTLNYDLEKKRALKLSDMFKPDAKYLEIISAYCLKILQRRPPESGRELAGSEWASGIKADTENYDNWNLMSKGLLITFNEYQLSPYFAGQQSVLIPYSDLKSIAKPSGAIARITNKK